MLLLDKQPSVAQPSQINAEDMQQIRSLLGHNYSTARSPSTLLQAMVNETELNLVTRYGLKQLHEASGHRVTARIKLLEDAAQVWLSYQVPEGFSAWAGQGEALFVNLSGLVIPLAEAGENGLNIAVKRMKLGFVGVPDRVADYVAGLLHRYLLEHTPSYSALLKTLEFVSINNHQLVLNYASQDGSLASLQQQVSSIIVSEELKQGLLAFAGFFEHYSQQTPTWLPMSRVLKDAASHAQKHMHLPVSVENKAMFISLAAQVMNRKIERVLGMEQTNTNSARLRVRLSRRSDLAKHFIISAAITSLANPLLAEVIGLEKEMKDASSGSGFSYRDLAADLAGIQLAKVSIQDEVGAVYIQSQLASDLPERSFMPDVSSLPEGIRESYGSDHNNISSQVYKEFKEKILRQIIELPIYSQLEVENHEKHMASYP